MKYAHTCEAIICICALQLNTATAAAKDKFARQGISFEDEDEFLLMPVVSP